MTVVRALASLLLARLLGLFGLSLVLFAVLRLIPGDPAATMLDQYASPELIAKLRAEFGLGEPIPVQYGRWLDAILHGSLGTSFVGGRSVNVLLAAHWVNTAGLALGALAFAVLLGIPAGVLAAAGIGDWFISLLSYLAISIPSFVLAVALLPFWRLGNLILPILLLGVIYAAPLMRLTRASTRKALAQAYIVTARSKGLHRRQVLWKHALPNALLPIVTMVAVEAGYLLGGVVVVEVVFDVPGLGMLLVDSISARDYPTIQACILLAATAFLAFSALADVLYLFLEPRLRTAGQAAVVR